MIHVLDLFLKERKFGRMAITAQTGVAAAQFLAPTLQKALGLFVCDQISFVSTKFIGLVEKRLRQLTGHLAPFGGVAVVLAADMRQLSPVSGQLWCADLVHSLYAPTCAGDGDAVVGSVDRGLAALRTMQLVQLTRLMRAMDDPSFVDAQIKMRRTNVVRPVDDALLNRLANPTLQYSAADINTDEA